MRTDRHSARSIVDWLFFCLTVLIIQSSVFGAGSDTFGLVFEPPRSQLAVRSDVTPKVSSLRGTEMTRAQWRQLIDDTWGPGDSPSEQLRILDLWWTAIDRNFACFQDLDLDWTAVRDKYRPEVQAGVSRGRFAAIMNHMALQLRESSTFIVDYRVSSGVPTPGIPLLFCGLRSSDARFLGAALTPLPDKTLLVYEVLPDPYNPLGLQPGDTVLGYEGRLWKEIYPELLAAELPLLRTAWVGSTASAYEHTWLASAGLNWHLFETIDVRKRDTGEVLHLQTSVLAGKNPPGLIAGETLLAGIQEPATKQVYTGTQISAAIIEEVGIGYVSVDRYQYSTTAGQEFLAAIQAVKGAPAGIIIDLRKCGGGGIRVDSPGVTMLFETTTQTVSWVYRIEGGGHLDLNESQAESGWIINGGEQNAYSKPIAVLVGPANLRDDMALWMTLNPRARIFGKPTAGSFGAARAIDLGSSDWFAMYTWADQYLMCAPGRHMARDSVRVDEPVWLMAEDVAAGRDTVVEAAIRWLEEENSNPKRQFVIPQLSRNSLGNTGIALTNPSGEDLEIELTAFGLNGTPIPFAQNPARITMQGRSQLAQFVDEIFCLPSQVNSGWVEVKSQTPVAGLFQVVGSGRMDGANGLSVPAGKLIFPRLYSGLTAYRGAEARTKINLVNPSATSCIVILSLVEKKNGTVFSSFAVTLRGHGTFFTDIGELFARVTNLPEYYLVAEVSRGSGIVGFESISFPGPGSLVGLDALVPSTGQSLYSAQLASMPGVFTSVSLINSGLSTRQVMVGAIDNSGSLLAQPVLLTLAPGVAIERYANELFTFPVGLNAVGSLRVQADGPGVIGDVLFGDPGYLRTAAALPLQPAGFRNAIFSQVANGMGMFTGLALYNPAEEPADIQIEVFSLEGDKTGEANLVLGPGQRLSRLLHELAPETEGQIRGYIRLSSSAPIVAQELFGTADLLSAVPPVVID